MEWEEFLTLVAERISGRAECFRRYAAVMYNFIRVNNSICAKSLTPELELHRYDDGRRTNVGFHEQLHPQRTNP